MPEIDIRKHVLGDRGRYAAHIKGVPGEADIVFVLEEADVMSANHTEAPQSMRGTGVAMALVEFMVADARASGFRIVARCPYIRAQLEKHPEWRDVMDESGE